MHQTVEEKQAANMADFSTSQNAFHEFGLENVCADLQSRL